MGLRDVNRQLKEMEKSEIMKLISEMYTKIPQAKEFLDVFATGDISELTAKYKAQIEKYIYPHGRAMILQEQEARKLIQRVRRMKIIELSIELELHYVTCCLEVINDFGYFDDKYYYHIEKMFFNALNSIQETGQEDKYKEQLMSLANDGAAYGLEFEYYG
jgi:hypothetical protein